MSGKMEAKMFDLLDSRQKTALHAAAKRMMIADARIRQEELSLYNIVEDTLGPHDEPSPSQTYGKLDLTAFKDDRSRRILLLTLSAMAWSDGEFHATESTLLKEVRQALEVSDEEMDEVLTIAEDQGSLVRELILGKNRGAAVNRRAYAWLGANSQKTGFSDASKML